MESPLRQTTKHNIFKRIKNKVKNEAEKLLNLKNLETDVQEVNEKITEEVTGQDPLTDKNKQSLKNYQSLYGEDFDPRNIMENFNMDSDTLLVHRPSYGTSNQQLASLNLQHPNENFKGTTRYNPRVDNNMEMYKGFNFGKNEIDFSKEAGRGSDVEAEHWNKQKLMDRWQFNQLNQ